MSEHRRSPGRQQLIILGTGGTCLDILDTVLDLNGAGNGPGFDCIGFLDDNPALWGSTIQGVPVLGSLASASQLRDCVFVNGIGNPSNYTRREAMVDRTGIAIERFATLIHPTASVSRTARIGRGVVIFQYVTVTSNVRIGNHVVILPNTVVSHDDQIADFTCVAGGVKISGGVRVGRGCYLGTGCALIGGIEVGDGALVGMGSVVIRSVPPNVVVAGNPARFLRHVVAGAAASA
jgi:sugar O-acyltransferase (sialic acid O-acetyltransferase NeuD family)